MKGELHSMDDSTFINGRIEPNDYDDTCICCMMQHSGLCPFEFHDWILSWDYDCPILLTPVCD